MKNLFKTLSIVLAICLLFAITGCSGEKDKDGGDSKPSETSVASQQDSPNKQERAKTPTKTKVSTSVYQDAIKALDEQLKSINEEINPKDPFVLDENDVSVLNAAVVAKGTDKLEINALLDAGTDFKGDFKDQKQNYEYLISDLKEMFPADGAEKTAVSNVEAKLNAAITAWEEKNKGNEADEKDTKSKTEDTDNKNASGFGLVEIITLSMLLVVLLLCAAIILNSAKAMKNREHDNRLLKVLEEKIVNLTIEVRNNASNSRTMSSMGNNGSEADKRRIIELESEVNRLANQLNNFNARTQEQDARRQQNDQKQRILSMPVTQRYTEVMNSKGNLTDYGFRPCALEHNSSGFTISYNAPNPKFYAIDEGGSLSIVPSEEILKDTMRSFFEPFFNVNCVYNGSTLYLGSPAKLVAGGIANTYDVRERGNVTV